MALPPSKRSHVFLAKFCIGTEEMHTRFWMIRTRRSCMTQASVGSKEWTCWWLLFSPVPFWVLEKSHQIETSYIYIFIIRYTWLLLFLRIWENLTLNGLLCNSEGQTWHGSVIAPFSCLEPRVSPKTERLALEFFSFKSTLPETNKALENPTKYHPKCWIFHIDDNSQNQVSSIEGLWILPHKICWPCTNSNPTLTL